MGRRGGPLSVRSRKRSGFVTNWSKQIELASFCYIASHNRPSKKFLLVPNDIKIKKIKLKNLLNNFFNLIFFYDKPQIFFFIGWI